MNRRSFFRNIGLLAGALSVGLTVFRPCKVLLISDHHTVSKIATMGGFKGDDFLKDGFIYAPYIPLYCTSQLVGNAEFAERFDKHCRSAIMMV